MATKRIRLCFLASMLLLCTFFGNAQCIYPVLNDLPNIKACHNNSIGPIAFSSSSSGVIFKWTNNNASIGLSQNGVGNIPAFTLINSTANPVISTITVFPEIQSTGNGFGYISNYGSSSVSVANLETNAVVETVMVGSNPYGISVSPNGQKVYVANRGSSNISVISTTTQTVINTIPVGANPQGVVVSSDNSKLYVSCEGVNKVFVINTVTFEVISEIQVGSLPNGIVISANTNRVYVANLGSINVSVINTITNQVESTINVGGGPQSLVLHPNDSTLYVANGGANNVSVINTIDNSLTTNIPIGTNPKGIAIHPNGQFVYATNYGSANISFINTTTNTVVNTLPVGNNPHGVAVSSDGEKIAVSNRGSGNISIINGTSHEISGTITVGSLPIASGNFIANGSICVGAAKTFSITANPISTLIPSVSIAASNNEVLEGTTITFTATPVNGGTQPNYSFRVDGIEKQNGVSNTYATASLTNGQVVTCVMTSSIACIQTLTANSNSIQVTINSGQNTYIFSPQSSNALYTDTANWVDRKYPGLEFSDNDYYEIIFRPNVHFKAGIIDHNLTIYHKASIKIDSGFHLTIMEETSITFTGIFNTFIADNSTVININGNLTTHLAGLISEGIVNVNGSLYFSLPYFSIHGRQHCEFDSLNISGNLWFESAIIVCNRVEINKGGSLSGGPGHFYWEGVLSIGELINDGSLGTSVLSFSAGTLKNSGSISCNSISFSGNSINSGVIDVSSTFSMESRPYQSSDVIHQHGSFENFGQVTSYTTNPFINVFTGNVINIGTMSFISDADSIHGNLHIFGTLTNNDSIYVSGGSFISTSQVNNNGKFIVKGSSRIQSGTFNNTGFCEWKNPYDNEPSRLQSSFLNTGTFKHWGEIIVGGHFYNGGIFEVFPKE